MGKPDAPKADPDSGETSSECDPVGHPVTLESVRTNPVPVVDVGMAIINTTVEKVEDVAEYDRSKSHGTPILGKTVNAKGLSHKSWIYTEEEAVRD
ncbi:MAG: hypothetical protein Q9207_001937 [Kuettlingeria erythrocarpa]